MDETGLTVQDKLAALAALVAAMRAFDRRASWALVVPTDPADPEWIFRVGRVECVGPDLSTALDLALSEASS